MKTLILVHGTGVRRPGYDDLYARVSRRLRELGETRLDQCFWGDLGAELKEGLSLPEFKANESPEQNARNEEINLWGALYENPLYELSILRLQKSKPSRSNLGQDPPGLILQRKAIEYSPSQAVWEKLKEAGLESIFAGSQKRVVEAQEFRDALKSASEALEGYREAIARAWVADAIKLRYQEGSGWVRASIRDDLVRQLVMELGGKELGLAGNVLKLLGSSLEFLVGRPATWAIKRYRNDLWMDNVPIPGDILRYQAYGEPIRDRILDALKKAEPPVGILAHSLGGVACVDFLIEQKEKVDLLITVGSQAPFLYEIGALGSLRAGQSLPESFPKWINIYDPRDFLSYVGERIFPDQVTDVRVDNGQPFPASHSTYWDNDAVWQVIGNELSNGSA